MDKIHTYEYVCTDRTDYAATDHLLFNPNDNTHEKLPDQIWAIHDPTTKNKQDQDLSSKFNSAISYHIPGQYAMATLSKA